MSLPTPNPPIQGDALVDIDAQAPDDSDIVAPDGYYWIADGGRQSFGPFATATAARADMLAVGATAADTAATLRQAEDELGIADRIDPDTGEPAEDQSPQTEDH